MRKIHHELENPIDHVLLHIAEVVSPLFYKLKFTPNMITTLSNIFAIIALYFLSHRRFAFAGLYVGISYFFDCLDGHYARKYKMVTIFGDYYDHISDILKIVLILLVFSQVVSKFLFLKIVVILAIVAIGLCVHLFYQELHYSALNTSPTLAILANFDLPKIEKYIHYTKYFGCGTFFAVLIACLVYCEQLP